MMDTSRRTAMRAGLAALATGLAHRNTKAATLTSASPVRVPARLRPGETVAIVAPAGVTYDQIELDLAVESVAAMGLVPRVGKHVMDRFGYLAGADTDRAADLNAAFADRDVRGIFAMRGGWGAARILPFLDYAMIARNPKPLSGFSDITSLQTALYAQCGLVSYHGPNAASAWGEAAAARFRRIVMAGEPMQIFDPPEANGTLAMRDNRIETIRTGTARGRLIGGNLTVFASLLGSPYFPDLTGHILCLEEVGEYIYRCDRMLTQLANAGVFDRIAGVAFGQFTDCEVAPGGPGAFSLMDVFEQHLAGRHVPSCYGLRFGHIADSHTLPFGIMAEFDAGKGAISLLEAPAR